MRKLYPILTILALFSCTDPTSKKPLFTLIKPDDSGIDFVNTVLDGSEFNVLNYRNFYNGGGVSIGDLNNDGLADIYFTANMGENKLYLNQGDLHFREVSAIAKVQGSQGWSTGVTFADVNADGRMDIYVCNSGEVEGDNKENELFINQGMDENGVPIFKEDAKSWNLNNKGYSTHASFFDYDLDGDLDCYILNNSFKKPEKIDIQKTNRTAIDSRGGDKLLRNDGGYFTDVTQEAGIYSSNNGFGLGISISDTNKDGYPDMYISNDFWERDYFYINQGDGTFVEQLTERFPTISMSSMGSDIADLNNDGEFDIFTTDMLAADNYRLKAMTVFDPYRLENFKFRQGYHYQYMQNSLQINNGNAHFSEAAHMAGVSATDWSWGALIFDMDNDGWKDIFVSNGIYKDIMSQDFATFINDKEAVKKVVLEKRDFDWRDFVAYIPSTPLSNFAFINQSQSGLPKFNNQTIQLGLDQPSFSNGSAYGDLDNDGDLDLVVNNVNMPAFVYRNNSTNPFLKISLKGKKGNVNGIGAQVIVENNGHIQTAQNYTSRGFQSSVESGFIFGFKNDSIVDKLTVIWPDKKRYTLTDIPVNKSLVIDQNSAQEDVSAKEVIRLPLFEEKPSLLLGNVKHTENIYNDFDHEILLHRLLSTQGPVLLKGDLNNDGLADILVGGASGDTDKLLMGTLNGWKVSENSNTIFETSKPYETTAGALVDVNDDGFVDIVLGGGGNEYQKGASHFKLRLYINDKSGGFELSDALSSISGNFSCILPSDYDNDGDIDLFVGASMVAGNYGLIPKSYLLQNQGNGQFLDITPAELSQLGLITAGTWTDINNDSYPDLVLVGEWSPVVTFTNINGILKKDNIRSETPSGWWMSVHASDLDGDGDEDLVVGNWGENSPFEASIEKPLELFVKDFDQNGKSEFIINWYPPLEETSYPFATKGEITTQLTMLKKTNLTYDAYAKKTYTTLFDKSQRQGAIALKAEELRTGIFWNEKNNWRFEPLSSEAQLSPVFSIVAEDFNGDQQTDLFLGGNFWGLKPQVGRMNSSKGLLLLNNGENAYEVTSYKHSGLEIEGEVRDALFIRRPDLEGLLIGINNKELKFYKLRK